MNKQALIKLASLRLAINYVIRARNEKRAAINSSIIAPLIGATVGGGAGYFLNPNKKTKLLTMLGGSLLGGGAGYGLGKAYSKYNDALIMMH